MSNNLPQKRNPLQTKLWLNNFSLLMTIVKVFIFGICLFLLYTIFGDSFNFQKMPIQTSNRANNPIAVDDDWDKVENGVHLQTGLIYDAHFDIVRANCTACHSGKLVAQNRATRAGWLQMIRWMQETQGLWDLGINEPKILDYLAKNYAPTAVGRRTNIEVAAVEWYILELEK